jgi:eukaryotic-like serine/threonine-protein kinase
MLSKATLPRWTRPLLLIVTIAIALGAVACGAAPSRGWSGPLVADGVLYVGTIQGKVVAYNVLSQEQVWAREVAEPQSSGGAFSCVTCSGSQSSPMSLYGTPAARGDRLYIGAYNGEVLWVARDGTAVSSHTYDTGKEIVGSVTIDGDTLYVGNSDGKVFALDLTVADFSDSLKEGWPFETGGKIWSTPVVKDGVVYVSSADHRLYAIDAGSGNEIWHFEVDAAFMSTPLVMDGMVYIGGCDRKFYSVAAATEEERLVASARDPETPSDQTREAAHVFEGASNWFWTRALAYDGQIWVGCLDHKVYVLDAETLEKTGEIKTDGMVYSPPVASNGLVVAGSRDGSIYLINPETLQYWAYAIDPENSSVTETYGVDPETGEVVKSEEKIGFTPAPILAPLQVDESGSVVYVHAQNGKHILHAFDLSTREVLWSFRTDEISED